MLASFALLLPVLSLLADQPAPARPFVAGSGAEAPRVSPEARGRAYYDFLLARHLESEGDIDGAAAALKRAAASDPESAEVLAELAGLFARQNRGEEALAAAEAALAIDADNSEAHWVVGSIHSALLQSEQETGQPGESGHLDKAVFHLEKARPARGYDLGLVLTLGRLYLAKSDYAKAVEALGALVQREPGIVEAGFLLAQALEGAGRRDDAIDALQRTVEVEPRFFRAWMLMADLLEKDQRYKEAAGAYEQAARHGPRNGELRMRQASALLASGAAGAARDVLEDVVKSSPTDVMALSLLSEAQRRVRDLDAAEATARRITALDPKGVRGPYAVALVLEQRHDFDGVVRTLSPVLDEQADARSAGNRMYLGALVRLGYAHQELGRYDEAVATFERARRLAPEDGLADLYLAQAQIAAGRYVEAAALARAGRERRPDDGRFARLEAQALRESGKFDEAVAVLREQMARGGDVSLSLSLSTVLSEARRWEEAEAVLVEAERAFPGEIDVPFQRGALLEQQKRFADAERVFREVLARNATHAPTLNYLGYMLVERGERLDEAIG
ncbi:MAG: tetratricopeptide repeat protein, partial [Vicinamibacterales bacterium]|nr:tetratricopeptide repeat protein [Vicinamibacterales bacterium]